MANTLKKFLQSRIIFQVHQSYFSTKWMHRQPKKVYSSYEEYEKLQENNENFTQTNEELSLFDKYSNEFNRKSDRRSNRSTVPFKSKINSKPLLANSQGKKKTSVDMFETVLDNEGNFIYTKMENLDQRVGELLTHVKNRKDNESKDIILLEGKRLIKDALEAGCTLKYLLFSRAKEVDFIKAFLPKMGAKLYKMPYREMQIWSDLTTTPGIMGLFRTPDVKGYQPVNQLPLTVICDNIREPGNLGIVLRICAGVGVEKVILTKGCVNLWDTKVLRSASGAHFRLQIHSQLDWAAIGQAIAEKSQVYIADNRVISSSEANGDLLVEVVEKTALIPYYGANFGPDQHHVLVVGGETEGISMDAYNLALKTNGVRLNIPLSNKIESINVGSALGVILFEIKRQLLKV